MLKTRVIPTLLWKGASLVKGASFDSWRRVGAALPAIKVYNTRDVDELVLLDISATHEAGEPNYDEIENLSAECFVPLTVGGGINNIDQVAKILRAGADKITINTAGYENPGLIRQTSDRFGAQCVVVSIDVRKSQNGAYECFSHCGTRTTGRTPLEWAREVESLGAGEILLTSVERDGTMAGYDLDLIRQVTDSVQIPVIVSGGAGSYEHLLQAIRVGKASAVAASSMFLFTQQTPLGAKQYLAANGVPIRNSGIRK
jgi:cyclase